MQILTNKERIERYLRIRNVLFNMKISQITDLLDGKNYDVTLLSETVLFVNL